MAKPGLKIIMAASEAVPYAKTGGLGDVIGALTEALAERGQEVSLMLPLYRGIKEGFKPKDLGIEGSVQMGQGVTHKFRLWGLKGRAYFIDCPEFFDREELYGTPHGEYSDNALRFIFFSRAVMEAAIALKLEPDIFNFNDWQTGLAPLYLRTFYGKKLGTPASVFTIHNIGYQGIFPSSVMAHTGLPYELYNPGMLEYYGQLNMMKAGILSADSVSTVSPGYAGEITTRQYGFGLEGVIKDRQKNLYGILNGMDYGIWDPAHDIHIAAHYGPGKMQGKAKCKETLCARFALGPERPLLGMVSRLASQKGLDIAVEAAPKVLGMDMNMVFVGSGDIRYQEALRELAAKNPGRVGLHLGYDEALAHSVFAGSDMVMVPSKYEPCGLTPMIGMRYAAVPVVRSTGGLADMVRDFDPMAVAGTGFVFEDYTAGALVDALKRALCVYTVPERWGQLVTRCMGMDFSWASAADKYVDMYGDAIRRARGQGRVK